MVEAILKKIHQKLLQTKKTICVAESCSGGLLSSHLSSLPGASNYFLLGVVAYSNKSKTLLLKIPAKIISKYGAVSSQVAILMAKNIRQKIKADFSLSITGIAGPAGATAAKPLGTVFICFLSKNKNICRKFSFRGNRQKIRRQSVHQALNLLCAHLSP